ncbi:hypothetical protein PE066_07220 [Ramlibacter tataouinensis]|uniref:hypothetical protein n=1 Tax=Ramlibacter tataouinensis TaxID=94132 RepID=UPI0022F3AB63|nr:hypothetical protein [Ramlibacter tataouinensis]WBY03316.1 hypothetical protein PE066_07220 [Ramlibacter tataouinensis]
MPSTTLRLQFVQVLATMALFLVMLWINDWLFRHLEFAPGINWIYLPAGVRLLCTLLFAEAGAIGLLLVSWLVSFLFLFPHDPERAFAGGILAALAPWLVWRGASRAWGLQASLVNLTPLRLLVLALVYSVASPLLHHLWFAWRGQDDLLSGFFAMFVGDLAGTLIVLYGIKGLLAVLHRPSR